MGSLGQRIVHYRKRAGFSQKALAAAIEVSPQVLSYYENGRNDPPTTVLVKIAEVLNITGDKLLGLEEVRPNPAVYKNRFEYTLLREIRFLNHLGQERALEYISELKELPKYAAKK